MTQKQTTQKGTKEYELLEELTDAEENASAQEESIRQETVESAHAVKFRNEIAHVIKLYNNPNLAVMILDNNLTIIYSTPMTAQLFKDYYTITRKPFFNIFHQTLEHDSLRSLIISLKSYEAGYSWTGTLKHKTPKTRTLHTRTVIIPFFSHEHVVAGFQVLFEDITSLYHSQLRSTFTSILEASKLKDNDTGRHNERVSYYCKKMSEYLYQIQKYPQIEPDFIENIGYLAAMHDVGKIGTPDYILQKPGKLTALEWEIMREHTINGTFILSSYPVPMAKEIALSHHEWWNGMGYPFKLEGNMIPLSARIVTIADVYDALRMKRSYKEEFTHEEAVQIIKKGAETQFDPELIVIFEEINEEFAAIWNLLKDSTQAGTADRDRSREFADSM